MFFVVPLFYLFFYYFSGTMYASGHVLCCQMEDKLTALLILAALPKPHDDGGEGDDGDDGDGDGGDDADDDADGDGDDGVDCCLYLLFLVIIYLLFLTLFCFIVPFPLHWCLF